MQQKNTALAHSNILEKYTNTGSSRYQYSSNTLVCSPNFYEIFNLVPDESSIAFEWSIPCFSEHTQKLIETRIKINEQSLRNFEVKLPYVAKDGSDRWVRFCCEFISFNEVLIERITVFQDITDSVNLSQQNNFYQERIELALTSTKAGTWDYQVSSNELFWDESMFTLFEIQRPVSAMKFSQWIEHIHPDSRETFIDEFNQGLKNQSAETFLSFVVKTLTPLGSTKYIKVSARFYADISQKTERVVGTCIDVTENEIKTNKILEQATIAQNNALIAQDANEARARFIANVSHEIRTPMNAIMGVLQILDSYDFNTELKNLIRMASDSSSDLLQIINDVLDFSKIDAHEMNMESVDLNLETLLKNAEQKFQTSKTLNLDIKFTINEGLSSNRIGDPLRFNQVLYNLISNAIKFTDEGEVKINIDGNDDEIIVQVIDTGIGIDSESLELIFEPFKQADDTTTRKFGGTGLGLAISKKLAELMGGELKVASEKGKGTKFTFTVPFPSTSKYVSANLAHPLSNNIPNLNEQHILYAEDNEASIKIVSQLIRPTNAVLHTALNGLQALDVYRKTAEISIIILDIQMPLMNGIEVCRRIRAENKHIPIIALTANVMIEDQKNYFNMGFSHIVEKPIKFDKFYQTLSKI